MCQGHLSNFKVRRLKYRRFWPKLGDFGLSLQFEFTNRYEMIQKAWSSIEEMSTFFKAEIRPYGTKVWPEWHYTFWWSQCIPRGVPINWYVKVAYDIFSMHAWRHRTFHRDFHERMNPWFRIIVHKQAYALLLDALLWFPNTLRCIHATM